MNLQVDIELLYNDRIEFELKRLFNGETLLKIKNNSNELCVSMPKDMFDELFEELECVKNENEPLQMRLTK